MYATYVWIEYNIIYMYSSVCLDNTILYNHSYLQWLKNRIVGETISFIFTSLLKGEQVWGAYENFRENVLI